MLSQTHTVLEQLGYTIVSRSEDETIGIRRKWFWDCLVTNLTIVIFVRKIDTLHASMIEEDAPRMIAQARNLDNSSLPLGFQKGRAVIAIYLTDKVESDARLQCNSTQKIRFATLFFPAALEQSSGEVHYLRKTPIWGSLYFGKLRYPVLHLLDPANAPASEPLSVLGIVFELVGLISFFLLSCGCFGSLMTYFLLLLQNAR